MEGAFGGDIDYAMLVRIYGDRGGSSRQGRKCSPGECTGTLKRTVEGRPKEEGVSTGYVERQNLTMRMSMRRFTRLTNAFCKKIKNHAWSVALHFMHHNFCRIHQTLKVTPAMEAGVTDRLWDLDDIVRLVDEAAPKPNRPKTYRRKISKCPPFRQGRRSRQTTAWLSSWPRPKPGTGPCARCLRPAARA